MMKKFLLVVVSMLALGQPLHAEQKEGAPLKSTLTMEELKDGEFTSAYGKRQYFKDIPEYVNTQCSTKTYTYKTPYFQFEVQEGFSVKYYTKKGGHRDYAVVALRRNKTEKVPKDCANACVVHYYEARLIMSAYQWRKEKYIGATWPLEKYVHDELPLSGLPTSMLEEDGSAIGTPRNVRHNSDKTSIITRWKTFSFTETSIQKRELEILLPNGLVLLMSPITGGSSEVKKLEDCFLDTVIKTIKPR